MTTHRPSGAVPKLRFREFADGDPWTFSPLGKLAKRISKRNTEGADLRPLTNSADQGIIDQRDYFDKDIAGNTDTYFVVERGDYVYNPRVSAAAPVGPISRNQLRAGVMSPLYTVFRFTRDTTEFPAYYFRSHHWHGFLRRVSNSGARHDRMAITADDLMQMPVPTPTPREQQLITECLSALDRLIAAEQRKLDALRTHKHGLTQQLFPQAGASAPRLRFPEFRAHEAWKPHKIGDFVLKSFYGTSASTPETGQYPVLRMGNMVDGRLDFSNLVYIDLSPEEFASFRLEKGDILLNRTNSRDLVGKVAIFDADIACMAASYIVAFRLDAKRLDPSFCNLMLNTRLLQARIKLLATPSISQANINPTTFRNGLDVAVPSLAEQKRIAACLSSLDALLAAQARKVELLNAHLHGLLQNLLTSPVDNAV